MLKVVVNQKNDPSSFNMASRDRGKTQPLAAPNINNANEYIEKAPEYEENLQKKNSMDDINSNIINPQKTAN